MKIFVDGRTIKENPGGLGLWNLRLVQELLNSTNIIIHLLVEKNCSYQFSNDPLLTEHLDKKLVLHVAPYRYTFVSFTRFFFEQFQLPRIIHRVSPDIFHATDSFGIPFFLRRTIRTILTIHDLIPLTSYREYITDRLLHIYNLSLSVGVKKADMIVAISDKTKEDIITYLHVKPESVRVIYDGVDPSIDFSYIDERRTWDGLKKAYRIQPKEYIFYYGGFGKRRNIPTNINVFSELKKRKLVGSQCKLLLSGRVTHAKAEALKNLTELKSLAKNLDIDTDVIFADYLSPIERSVLLKNCLLFLSLSLYEGFGLSPIEALEHKTATLFSQVGIWKSYPKKSIFLIEDPLSQKEIIEKITKILTTKNYLTEPDYGYLLEYIKQFTWENMAKKYIKIYYEINTRN